MMEMLVVLAILAILLAVGSTSLLGRLDTSRLDAAVRDMITIMQQARMTAIRNNADTAVLFDAAQNTYSLCTDSGDGRWSTKEDNVCPKTIRLASYASGIRYGHGKAARAVASGFGRDDISYRYNRVAFTPRGTARHAGYAYLENKQGQSVAVGTITVGTILSRKWDGKSWKRL